MVKAAGGERFFFVTAWLLLAIVIAGFGGVQIAPGDFVVRPMTPLIAAHAAVVIGWFALLIVQPYLIRTGNIARHMQFGMASVALAVAIPVLGYLVIRHAFADPS